MIISVPDCAQCSTFGLTYLPWLASSAPARPRGGAGDDEAGELVAVHREADRLGARLVLADGDRSTRPKRECISRCRRKIAASEDDEHDVVESDLVAEVDEPSVGALRQRQALVAAVRLHRVDQVEHHLREGERDHDEVHAARAQRDRADEPARRAPTPRPPPASRSRRWSRPSATRMLDDVGAGADERGVAEGDHAAVAEHQVQAGRGDGVDHHAAGEADVEQVGPPTASPAESTSEESAMRSVFFFIRAPGTGPAA